MASFISHDVMSVEQRSALMGRIRSKNTFPEKTLRKAVWALGLRYRLYYKIGRIKPDLVFVKARVAIFVDGCFWHQCPEHGVMPKSNRAFWEKKLAGNVQRDGRSTKMLTENGWAVLRFWEHDINASAKSCARRVKKLVVMRLSTIGKGQR